MKWTLKLYLSLAFIFAFDIWTNNSEVAKNFFGGVLKPLDDFRLPLIWTILFFAGCYIYHRDRMEVKEKEKEVLQSLTRSRMELLVMANQQLSAYRIRDILIDLFRRYVSLHPYVIGVQLYEYTLSHHNGRSSVKLLYVDGAVQEKIDVNAAQQIYYSFDVGMYREFLDAYQALYLSSVEFVSEAAASSEESQETFISFDPDDSLENLNPKPMMEFIQKYNHELSIKPLISIDHKDAIIYAFIVLGLEVLEQAVGNSIEYFLDQDKVKALESKKRTGFLQSVLLGDSPYTFSHKGRNEKADRSRGDPVGICVN